MSRFARVSLMGMPLDVATADAVVEHVVGSLSTHRGGAVMTPNVDHLRRFVRRPELRRHFFAADVVVADGQPLVWAARLQGTPIPARVAGSDLVLDVARAAGDHGFTVFLLGGAGRSAEGAAAALARRVPGLRVVGTHSPSEGFEARPEDVALLHAAVVSARPDIVLVGLPFPKADRLIEELRHLLPEAWFFALGVTFSFLSGEIPRAPLWMQRTGLEWVHRLRQEPRRLFRRYVVDGIPFALVMFGSVSRRRLTAGGSGR
jgi:N-acetylglucosaminyldiphosphoundecaprenol N-acetyl-beta-D-mannosaminyltransferase